VYKIFKAIAGSDDERTIDLANQYRAGGMGYGHAKKALADLILDHFGEARKLREKLMADPGYVQQVLADGAAAAREKVGEVTERARKAVGF
jgi:tryptophanyl-tRNA synthetase